MVPSIRGYKVECVGDDIAWMRFDEQGNLRAINPEAGFFGVCPGKWHLVNSPGCITYQWFKIVSITEHLVFLTLHCESEDYSFRTKIFLFPQSFTNHLSTDRYIKILKPQCYGNHWEKYRIYQHGNDKRWWILVGRSGRWSATERP